MSERDGKFQKSSKTFGGGGKGRGRPPGGGFGKRFEGDKPARSGGGGRSFGRSEDRGGSYERRDSKPRFSDDSGARPYKKREFGDRPYKKREFGDRDGRSAGGDRPYKKREFGDRPERSGSDRPYQKREFGDRPERSGGDRPYKKREFGDRDGRSAGGDRPYKKREFGDRPERSGGDRPFKSSGDRPFKSSGDRPFKSGGDRGGFKRDGDRPERGTTRFDQQKTYRRDSFNPREKKSGPKPRGAAYDDARMDVAAFQTSEASSDTRNRLKSDRASFGAPSSAFLYGAHAVREALQNPKRLVQRLLVTENGFEAIREAYEAAQASGLKMPQPQYVDGFDLERLLPRDAVHQGILLDVQPLEEVFLPDVLNAASEDAKILVLDQVTDPHNVGAILRTAVAFGATAVIVQKLHAPEVTGTLAKSASGAVEHCPIVRETNLSRALEQLKEAGFFCIGLDERGKGTVAEAAPKGRVALVLGAEGEGLRRLVSENCDTLAKLPTSGPIASLNVSNAAAVALYELIRK
ncbi:MAG: 23S rRNA (guanosine(2251)-2'-O)-methyltransferase RlmB [Micavibrio sp.]|nr:23S rRNA (guanosine(2251)-2'-O)-methyltransferase RlmB [Micavibrio sp.]